MTAVARYLKSPRLFFHKAWHSIVFRITRFPREIKERRFRFLEKKLKRQFPAINQYYQKPPSPRYSASLTKLLKHLTYKDENWNYVVNLESLLKSRYYGRKPTLKDNPCDPKKLTIIDEMSVTIDAPAKPNNWIYWYLEQDLGTSYILEFDTTIRSHFTEFQIAFKHLGIADRYRFRVVDNKSLVFEVITKGFFFHGIQSTPFSFELNRPYKIRVEVINSSYAFVVDNEIVLAVRDKSKLLKEGGIAFIFWDQFGREEIKLALNNITLRHNSTLLHDLKQVNSRYSP